MYVNQARQVTCKVSRKLPLSLQAKLIKAQVRKSKAAVDLFTVTVGVTQHQTTLPWFLSMPSVSAVQNTRFGGRKLDSQVMTRRVNWLNSIREWQQDFLGSLDAREFVDCVTDELFGKGVFVFTPFGEVMRLPKVALHFFCVFYCCSHLSGKS